jgi:hypothetical protein
MDMTKLFKQIGDEVIEYTPEEYARQKADEEFVLEIRAAESAKLEAKEAAQAKLTALGLTTDDLKALGL